MIKKEEIKQNWKKIENQLGEADRFIGEDKPDEALYFIWLAAEYIVNNLKFVKYGLYLKNHNAKTRILKEYFIIGVLKNDYSDTFERLSKYRIVAEFHPYTSIPKDYTREDVLSFLEEIQELKGEVEKFLIKKDVLR
jgi:uncharacterized protein (UPF0332 family)